jgi:hypothetical protein
MKAAPQSGLKFLGDTLLAYTVGAQPIKLENEGKIKEQAQPLSKVLTTFHQFALSQVCASDRGPTHPFHSKYKVLLKTGNPEILTNSWLKIGKAHMMCHYLPTLRGSSQ